MKYKVVEVPWINYEVQDEEGRVYFSEEGNVFETKEEAEQLIKELEFDQVFYKPKGIEDE
jgi:hypothetical protein